MASLKAVPFGAHRTILLIEDDDPLRELLHEVLQDAGYLVLESRSRGDALAICESHPGPIDLLVSDMGIPGLSRDEFAAGLDRTRPGLRVFYISGNDEKALGHAGAAFMQKPFPIPAFLDKIRELLDAEA